MKQKGVLAVDMHVFGGQNHQIVIELITIITVINHD